MSTLITSIPYCMEILPMLIRQEKEKEIHLYSQMKLYVKNVTETIYTQTKNVLFNKQVQQGCSIYVQYIQINCIYVH